MSAELASVIVAGMLAVVVAIIKLPAIMKKDEPLFKRGSDIFEQCPAHSGMEQSVVGLTDDVKRLDSKVSRLHETTEKNQKEMMSYLIGITGTLKRINGGTNCVS